MNEPPAVRIVRGEPSPEELAALTALLSAAGAGGDDAPVPPVRGRWNDPARSVRRYWPTGTGGWRSAR